MLSIITVPALSDNYIWLICDENKKYAVIVDPGEAAPVINALQKNQIEAVAILVTHFHFDHGNGIADLLQHYPDLPVYGPSSENKLLSIDPHPPTFGPASNCFDSLNKPLNGGEDIYLDKIGAHFKVLNIPGHTSGHIAYYDATNKKLFCGDTLFAGGCGRVFDGTYKDLYQSLQTIMKLPEDTLIYCAHEYTLDNLGFAKWVEPHSKAINTRLENDMGLIDADRATVPSLLSLELATNPFLRTHMPQVVDRVTEATGKKLSQPEDVFAAMRIWKDSEYD